MTYSAGQSVARGERISPRESSIGQQVTVVSATIERLTNDLSSTGRTHGEYGDTAVGVLLLDAERLLERV